MILPHELFEQGQALLFKQPPPSEVDIRRAVSAFYHAPFHTLSQAGAKVFSIGGTVLEAQASRAFNHTTMRKVCEAYSRRKTLPAPPNGLAPAPPSRALMFVCDKFALLQQARHAADYDQATHVTLDEGLERWADCRSALNEFRSIAGTAEAAVFLAALLPDAHWTRRG